MDANQQRDFAFDDRDQRLQVDPREAVGARRAPLEARAVVGIVAGVVQGGLDQHHGRSARALGAGRARLAEVQRHSDPGPEDGIGVAGRQGDDGRLAREQTRIAGSARTAAGEGVRLAGFVPFAVSVAPEDRGEDRRGDSPQPGQGNLDRGGVDAVLDVEAGAHRAACPVVPGRLQLVDFGDGEVGRRVDQAGRDHAAVGVDHAGVGRRGHRGADCGDPAVPDHQRSRRDRPGLGHRLDPGVDDGDGLGRRSPSDGQNGRGEGEGDGAAHWKAPSAGWPSSKSDLGWKRGSCRS